MMDGSGEKKVDEMCTYILIDSRDELSISLTPHAIDVIMTVSKVCRCIGNLIILVRAPDCQEAPNL